MVPIQFEVKTFWTADSKLYLAVTLTKIDSEVLEEAFEFDNSGTPLLFPESTYSLQSIFKNVNPQDGRFLKYVPDGFLNAEQKQAKADALAKQKKEYESYALNIREKLRLDVVDHVIEFFNRTASIRSLHNIPPCVFKAISEAWLRQSEAAAIPL